MTTSNQTINEERGARRAAELRRRFSAASKTARRSNGIAGRDATYAFGKIERSTRKDIKAALVWIAMAAIIAFVGSVLF